MRKHLTLTGVLLLLVFLIFGCSAAENKSSEKGAPQPPVENWSDETGIKKLTDTLIAGMTLEEKIGQMMFVGIHGTALTEIQRPIYQPSMPAASFYSTGTWKTGSRSKH